MQHLQPNTTLQGGKYRIERVLGQGGFGITYVGYNTEFEETVAIKEFYLSGINDREGDSTAVSVSNGQNIELFEEQKEKFKKEARRMRQFNNPHIVRVHDLFEENGTAYYVMDYIDGENLAQRMKRTGKPMSQKKVFELIPQILDALKVIHDANIWHLDLKPSNIMLDKNGNAKLIDFGASKQLDSQKGGATTGTRISYTPGFAPREQMEQNYDKFGPWTDIYALGATLYNLLTNKRPPLPSDIDDDDTEDKHIALPIPHSVSNEMQSLIIWLMKTNYKERPKSVISVQKLIEGEIKTFSATNDNRGQVSPQIAKTAIVPPSISKATADSQATRVAPETHKVNKVTPLYSKTTNNHQTNFGNKPNVVTPKKSSSSKGVIGIIKGVFITIISYGLFCAMWWWLGNMNNSNTSSQTDLTNSNLSSQTEYYEGVTDNFTFNSKLGECQYNGTIDENKRPHGNGTAKFSDGRYYKGPFNHGVFEGKDAFFKYGNGDTFKGEFRNNSFYYGTYTIASDKSYFVGDYKNGQPNRGTWYDKNSKVIEKL
jgi:serine/threonine-protein kinase